MLNKLARLQRAYEANRVRTEAAARSNGPTADAELQQLKAESGELLEAIHAERERVEAERALIPDREAIDRDPAVTGDFGTARRPASRPRTAGPNGRRYADMFGAPPRSPVTAEDFFSAVHQGVYSPDVMRIGAAVSTEGLGADGGYVVPQEFAARMLDVAIEDEIVRPRARIEPMGSDSKRVGGFDNSNRTGNSIGGFTAVWAAEAQSLTAQKGLFRAIELKAKKLAILAEVSNELIADGGITFDQMMTDQLGAGIGFGMDDAFLNGTGGAQPVGVLNDPAIITVAAEGGQASGTIVYENIVKMFSRMHPACVRNAVWIANVNTLPQLLTLQQKIKNVAGTENVGGSWVPMMTEQAGQLTLLTRPVLLTEKVPALGASGDISFVDLSQYVVGLRAGISIAKSSHLGFSTDTSHYRIIVRADGMGSWKAANTPKSGATLSWCVKLAAR